ncbi:hypothetical protein [Pseudonocardia spinosispora]|uniref:hypothetical protein n=1 Tax=Pseudonocardia spinosispora TaxID=103441 RepID=UPI0003FE2CCE|nr:hypothetical protein [Pseudonocardia spinosispora]
MKLGKRISVGEVRDTADQEPTAIDAPVTAATPATVRADEPSATPVSEPVAAHAER